jgi:dihydropteroate synthase
MRRTAAGVDIINDVSALTHDPDSVAAAAATGLPVILMHAQGDPATMQQAPRYEDALLDVYDYLESRIDTCRAAGIARDRIVVDPGIGFGKTANHNLEILAGLSLYHALGVPLMLGVSRKSFIGALTGAKDPQQRLHGSIAAALAGVAQGVQLLRVHDVAATRQALTLWQAASTGRQPEPAA